VKKTAKLILVLALSCLMVGNAQADLDDGLVAHYPFNGNAKDGSGNNNHGTVNGATLTIDRFENADGAYVFDGINDYIFVNGSDSLNLTEQITISAWINSNSDSAQGIVWKETIGSPNYSMTTGGAANGAANFTVSLDGVTWTGIHSQTYPLNEWHLLTSTYDGTKMSIFVDGQLSNSRSASGIIQSDINVPLGIGVWLRGEDWEPLYYFSGLIDDVRIYNRALSECEIKSLYTSKDECNPVDCSNNPATYSIEKNKSKLTIPFIDIPLLEPDTHQPKNEIGVFQGELKLKKGIFVEFQIVPNRLKFVSFTQTVDACHAVYSYQDKTLSIPFVEVGSEVYKATLKHLQEVPFDLGVLRLENYEFLHTLD
jgi:hypothetical protein